MAEGPWAAAGLEVLRHRDFRGDRLERPGTYVVCFGAAWCPVTRRFLPRFSARRAEVDGTLAIADITDLRDPLWEQFAVRITPSIVVFREGVVAARLDGRRLFGISDARWAELAGSMGAQ